MFDSETKAILSYHVGKRDAVSAYEFIGDLNKRIAETHRCQLTTDGLEGYIPAVEEHFGADVDFAQLVKQYAHPRTDGPDWFRPSSHVVAAIPTPIVGDPDFRRISTSHLERTNLTVRMHLRRFTRLTNGFSKKLENLKATVAVFMAWYNFCRVHHTLRVTPAMESRLDGPCLEYSGTSRNGGGAARLFSNTALAHYRRRRSLDAFPSRP